MMGIYVFLYYHNSCHAALYLSELTTFKITESDSNGQAFTFFAYEEQSQDTRQDVAPLRNGSEVASLMTGVAFPGSVF